MKQLYSRYFPTPSYLSMNFCALDISDSSVKYCELIATQDGLHLGRYGEIKIPSGVIVAGKIENKKTLIRILQNLKSREHLQFVRVSLPGEQMYLFTVPLPAIEERYLKETILLQIQEYVPLSGPDTTFDHVVVSENSASKIVEVAAVATSTVDQYISVLRQSGLTPLSFELEAQALARVAIPSNDDAIIMIIDFGQFRTSLSIASATRIFFTTTIDIGGDILTDMLAQHFSLSFQKAEEMKRRYALGTDANINDIFLVILSGLSVLRDDIAKHYQYWKIQAGRHAKDIDHIVLCGGDSNLQGLAEYIRSSMNMKVVHLDAWANILDMDVSVPRISFQESLRYATALGLALGDYESSGRPAFNLLPEKDMVRVKQRAIVHRTTVALCAFAIACLICTILLLPSYFFSISRMNVADQRLDAFNTANPQIASDDLDATVADSNAKLALLASAQSSYQVNTNAIQSVLADRTTGIKISNLIYAEKSPTSRTLEVHGVAATRDELYAFKSTLDADPHFSKVNLPISYFIGNANISFIITITMK